MTDLLGNPERLNKVADMIQSHPEHFDMKTFAKSWTWKLGPDNTSECVDLDLFECGTTACIAGWACNLWAAEVDTARAIDTNAALILGLSDAAGDRLFNNFDLRTADEAADHLRRMALDAERHQFGDAGAHDATTATVGQ